MRQAFVQSAVPRRASSLRLRHYLQEAEPEVKHVELGKTGLWVSRVGLGGIPVQRLTEAEAVTLIQHALDLGITFLDTANAYTTSEERMGQAIAGRRSQVVLATKTMARDRATAEEHLALSLRRLKTDAIDLWQLHNIGTFEALDQVLGPDGAMEAASKALQAGKVRHVGFSSHSMDVARRAVTMGLFETVQFPLNFISDEAVDELLPLVRQHGLGFIAMKPFGGGLLGHAPLAIKFLLQLPDVVPDPGVEKAAEIDEIVQIVNGSWELTSAEQAEMARLHLDLGTRFCRRCDYCQPCSHGVQISVLLHLRGFHKRFPLDVFATGFPAQAAQSGRQCQECGDCEERCPYGLPIREMVADNVTFFDSMITVV
jgi:predicted aldo/keto reductase-like oxidoreductase